MATKQTQRKNTALVFNPSRSLSIGSRRNPVKRRNRRSRRNPVQKAMPVRRNPSRRRRENPASVTGLVIAAVMAGVGVSLFDVITSRVIPQTSSLVRAGVKFGGAWLFQSQIGGKVPVLGKYKQEIALVLAVSGVIDLMKLYVLPLVSQTFPALFAQQPALIAVPAAAMTPSDGTTGSVYGNSYPESNFSPVYS